jgi:hypothetical protein
MPKNTPDPAQTHTPVQKELSRGLELWRVHSDTFAPDAFNPTVPGPFSGGRFDSHDGSYAHLYAGSDSIAAVAETLLRDRPPSSFVYQVPIMKIRGKRLSKLRLLADLTLVKLHGNGPAALGQSDDWITSCGPSDYPTTRLWAATIRNVAPDAAGIVYRPRHDNDRYAYVFFQDRCPIPSFEVLRSHPIDQPGMGFSLVNRAALHHNAVLASW